MRHAVFVPGIVSFIGLGLGFGACSTGSDDAQHGPSFVDDGGPDVATPRDATADRAALPDGGADSPSGSDAGRDSGVDSGVDAGVDAGLDAGVDSGVDAGLDAGADAGCTATMALLGGSGTTAFATTWSGGQWAAPTTLGAGANVASAPALVAYGSGYLGVVRESSTSLASTVFTSSWSPLASVSSATSQGAPSVATAGASAHLVYWGSDSKFYHATYAGGAWDAANDPVGGSGASQSFGPSAPTVASPLPTTLVVVQAGSDGFVYDQTNNGAWLAAQQHAGVSAENTISPRILALSGGADDLMLVFTRKTDRVLFYATRSASTGAWSPLTILVDTNTFTNEPVALAAVSNGRAVLAYRGGDGKGYFSTYDATRGLPWSPPLGLVAGTNPAVASVPSVATGVCGDDAVVAFATTDVQIASLRGGAWTAPASVAGTTGATFVGVATR